MINQRTPSKIATDSNTLRYVLFHFCFFMSWNPAFQMEE
jgi:hypothetical protein